MNYWNNQLFHFTLVSQLTICNKINAVITKVIGVKTKTDFTQ